MFDTLLSLKKPLPCSYCEEREELRLFSKLSDENFPLCFRCKEKGRGAGTRRKARKIQPKPVKQKKPKVSNKRKKRMRAPCKAWPLLLPSFSLSFFLSLSFVFCFCPTSGNLPCVKICFPQYFGITRRYMQKKYFF